MGESGVLPDAAVDSAVDLIIDQWTITHGQPDVSSPNGPLAAKQYQWDKPSIVADIARLTLSLPDRHHQARFLAVLAPHSGDWLHALPISSYGLGLDRELRWVYVLEPDFVSLISAHAAPGSTRKARTVSKCRQNSPSSRFI